MTGATYWGTYEWLTLGALVLGPVLAVGMNLWHESRRCIRDRQLQVARMLLSTRHLVSDPAYSTAINLIPVEFRDQKSVMEAWKQYIEAVRYQPTPENSNEAHRITTAKQTRLIFEVTKHLGFNLSESEIGTSGYVAGGYVERDGILIAGYRAWPEIAAALKEQNVLSRQIISQATVASRIDALPVPLNSE